MEKEIANSSIEETTTALDLPPPSVLRKIGRTVNRMAIPLTVEAAPLDVVTTLLENSPDGEVGLSRYKQAMRDAGYTGEAAVFELDALIRRRLITLSNRYRISLISRTGSSDSD